MRQEIADTDNRFVAISKTRPEIRQPSRHRIVKPDQALLDEAHGRNRNDRLRYRGQAEDRIFRHRAVRLAVRQAGSALVDELPVLGDKHDHTDEPLVVERVVEDGIEAFNQGIICSSSQEGSGKEDNTGIGRAGISDQVAGIRTLNRKGDRRSLPLPF